MTFLVSGLRQKRVYLSSFLRYYRFINVRASFRPNHDASFSFDKQLHRGGSVAEWLACWIQAQKGPGSNRSRDAVRVTVLGKLFTAIVPLFIKQQKLVAALLRVESQLQAWRKVMAAYRRVYDSFMTHVTCRLTAKNRDQVRNPTLGNRVWATFTFKQLHYNKGHECFLIVVYTYRS